MLYYRVKLLDTGFGIMESGSNLMSLEKEMRKPGLVFHMYQKIALFICMILKMFEHKSYIFRIT